jgi:hypothetical protein
MFKKTVLLVVCFVFVFSMAFMYGDDAEIQRLRAQGQREGWTFTVGKTSVSDIPLEQLCGLVIPKNWRQTAVFEDDVFGKRVLATPPDTYDWRDYGKVTPVRNQASCGSCWAFGMIGSYEAILAINNQGLNDLSEQFLVRCNSYGYGCDGGWWCYDDLYNGIPLESCYPYTGTDGSCSQSCTKYYPVDASYFVGSSSGVPSTSAIKQAIYDHGPVAAAVYVNSAFQNYSSGIFNSCTSSSPNHAIVLVGWGSTYWILRNSWGSGWGESGYMRITFGCSNVGYAATYAVPEGGTPPPPPPPPPGDDPYEPNDSAGTAYGPINSGEAYDDAEISTTSDADWFHFTIGSTGTITVSVAHESGEDLDWYLYKSTDTTNYVARGYTTNNPETGNYSATWVGKYYVKVIGYSGSTSTYTLTVTYPGGTPPPPPPPPDDWEGYYQFKNKYSGLSMDYNGDSYVYQYSYNGNTDKHWEIINITGDWYRIMNRYCGKALDVNSTSADYVYLNTWNGNTDKYWKFIELTGGYYRVDNYYSGNSLDVGTGGSGTLVDHAPWNGGNDKYWQIISVQ